MIGIKNKGYGMNWESSLFVFLTLALAALMVSNCEKDKEIERLKKELAASYDHISMISKSEHRTRLTRMILKKDVPWPKD